MDLGSTQFSDNPVLAYFLVYIVTKQKTKQNSWDALQKLYNDVFFGVTWFYMVIHHIKPCKTMYNGV